MRKLCIAFALMLPVSVTLAQAGQSDARKAPANRSKSVDRTNTTWTLSPMHLSEKGIGLGLGVEIFPGKNDILSISLPFSVSLPPKHNNKAKDDAMAYTPSSFQQVDHTKETFYFYPGIKVYPEGAFTKVSYAVGLNILVAVGRYQQVSRSYDYASRYTPPYYKMRLLSESTANISTFKVGPMLTTSMNIRPTKHFYMGVELGLGYSYISRNAGETLANQELLQLGVKLGYAY